MTVIERFIATATARPDAVAVASRSGAMTYAELERRSAAMAAAIRRAGIGRGDVVALRGERSAPALAALLGILRAGAAYMPLSASDPPGRVAGALRDAGARLAVSDDDELPPGIERRPMDAGDDAGGPMLPMPDPSDAAYVLFTSGSTGRAKGVVMPHASLDALVGWHAATEADLAARRTGQLAELTFDVSCQEIFSTLTTGGVLVVLDDALRRDARRLLEEVAARGVDRLFLPTALLPSVAEAGLRAPAAGLRDVYVAGSALRLSPAIRRFFAAMPGCRLHNHYGPTETHVVTAHVLAGDPASWPEVPPIGTPLPHVEAAVLDATGAPVADGAIGELVAGGTCLARGYAGRPELTARHFRPGPDGRPRYWTGDLVSRHGGELRYHGRADRQVKVRGHRVEPAAIEAALMTAPGVADCAVVPEGGGPVADRLIAYVVPVPDVDGAAPPSRAARVDGGAWAAHLGQGLPAAMVPSVWIALPALPATAHGKLDAAALPAPPRRRPELATPYAAPAGPGEARVCALFEELLDVHPIGADDDFFMLGGTSLRATELAARLGAASERVVGVEAILEARSPRAIAAAVASAPPPPAAAATPAAPTGELSRAQSRLLFAETLDPGHAANIVVSAHHLAAAPSASALTAAVADLCARHPLLAARFDLDALACRTADPGREALRLVVEDRAASGVAAARELARRIVAEEQRRPFDLEDRAARFRLVRFGDGSALFLLVAHHLVTDGWSEVVLLRDLSDAYRARHAGRAPSWDRPAAPYAGLVAEEAAWLASPEADAGRAWWARELDGLADLPLVAPPAPARYASAPLAATAPADGVARTIGTLGAALAERFDLDGAFGIGLVVSGRRDHRFAATAGPFINTLCLRAEGARLRSDPVGAARTALRRALAHERVPFDDLVAPAHDRDPERHPLCQVLVVAQSFEAARLDLGGPSIRIAAPDGSPHPFAIVAETWSGRDGVEGRLDVSAGAGSDDLARDLAQDWAARAAAPDPTPHPDVPLHEEAAHGPR